MNDKHTYCIKFRVLLFCFSVDFLTIMFWGLVFQLQCCGVNSSSDWTSGPPSSCPPGADVQVILLAIFLLLSSLFKLSYIINYARKDLNLPPRKRDFGTTTRKSMETTPYYYRSLQKSRSHLIQLDTIKNIN